MLILDSGAVSQLAKRSRRALAMIAALREKGRWLPAVPAVVLVECLQGHAGRDANENRLLKVYEVFPAVPESLARRAALLLRLARRGSAVDALVVASAEPGGTVLTSGPDDLRALAAYAAGVLIERIQIQGRFQLDRESAPGLTLAPSRVASKIQFLDRICLLPHWPRLRNRRPAFAISPGCR